MMLEKIIIMLTHNDKTVPDAIEIFEENKDLPIQYWGFKDVGMEPAKMKVLCDKMHEAGKTAFLEVVSYSEEECMRGAKLAVDCGFDYLLGTLYYDSVAAYSKSCDAGDTWYTFGLGGTVSLTDNAVFYGDIEKSFGGDVTTKWQYNVGLRFLW